MNRIQEIVEKFKNEKNDGEIRDRIYNIRGKTVMLDNDVAFFFNIETRRINEQMKRNIERFPDDFCFKLTSEEFNNLKSQIATSKKTHGGRKKIPYAYTEYGIIALAGVLKNKDAARVSIEIVREFVQMRNFLIQNSDILLSLAKLQNKQQCFENLTNERINRIFKMIEKLDYPKTALFCAGEWFDAYDYITSIVRTAKKKIIIVDPYCDGRALTFLTYKNENVKIDIYKGPNSKLKYEEISIFEAEYGKVNVKTIENVHDRYLIIDDENCYSLETSLNYAGKKLFTVNKIEDLDTIMFLINKLKNL